MGKTKTEICNGFRFFYSSELNLLSISKMLSKEHVRYEN